MKLNFGNKRNLQKNDLNSLKSLGNDLSEEERTIAIQSVLLYYNSLLSRICFYIDAIEPSNPHNKFLIRRLAKNLLLNANDLEPLGVLEQEVYNYETNRSVTYRVKLLYYLVLAVQKLST